MYPSLLALNLYIFIQKFMLGRQTFPRNKLAILTIYLSIREESYNVWSCAALLELDQMLPYLLEMRVCYDQIKQRVKSDITIIIGSSVTIGVRLFSQVFSLLGQLELIQILPELKLSLSSAGSVPK